MIYLRSLETRWFFPGSIPPEVTAWFANLGEVQAQPPRTDLYLLGCGEALGVKLREGRFEMKKRTAEWGEVQFTQGFSGLVESWVKWGIEAEADVQPTLDDDGHWTAVEKTRQILYYQLEADERVVVSAPGNEPETGGGLELTALRINGAAWWTIGVEVFGEPEKLLGVLLQIVNQKVQFLDNIPLAVTGSYSYPYWLNIIQEMSSD